MSSIVTAPWTILTSAGLSSVMTLTTRLIDDIPATDHSFVELGAGHALAGLLEHNPAKWKSVRGQIAR